MQIKRILTLLLSGIVALGLCGVMSGCGSSSDAEFDLTLAPMTATATEDGHLYLLVMDGSVIDLGSSATEATITSDRTHIVVQSEDGYLSVTDPNLSEEIQICKDGKDVTLIRDDGFLYQDTDGVTWRVLFDDCIPLKLGTITSLTCADDTLMLLYALDDGSIDRLRPDTDGPDLLGTYENAAATKVISNDGTMAAWTTKSGSSWDVWAYEGDTSSSLGTVENANNEIDAQLTKDQIMMTVVNSKSDIMWILKQGEDPIFVYLGSDASPLTVFADSGPVSEADSSEIAAFYVCVDGSSGDNVYCVSLDGTRERMATGVSDFQVAGGKAFYLNSSNTLCCFGITGSRVTKTEEIAGGVGGFTVSEDGSYVYFLKNSSFLKDTGTLYCHKMGREDSTRVSSNVHANILLFSEDEMICHLGAGGNCIYYYTDVESIGSTNEHYGTLLKWSFGDTSSTKLSEEAIVGSLTSGLRSQYIQEKNYSYVKYVSVTSNKEIYGDWCHYDDGSRLGLDQYLIW